MTTSCTCDVDVAVVVLHVDPSDVEDWKEREEASKQASERGRARVEWQEKVHTGFRGGVVRKDPSLLQLVAAERMQ